MEDPLTIFGHWYGWLKPGGKLVILDGLWSRKNWSSAAVWIEMIDSLLLSCLQTLATPSYLLRKTVLEIDWCGYMDRVNEVYAKAQVETDSPRYMIIAHKPE